MRECGEDDAKGMVSDTEGVRSLGGRDMSRSIRDGICVCVVVEIVVASDGGDGGGGVDASCGNSGVGDGGESGVCRSGGDSGSGVHRSVGGGLCGSG